MRTYEPAAASKGKRRSSVSHDVKCANNPTRKNSSARNVVLGRLNQTVCASSQGCRTEGHADVRAPNATFTFHCTWRSAGVAFRKRMRETNGDSFIAPAKPAGQRAHRYETENSNQMVRGEGESCANQDSAASEQSFRRLSSRAGRKQPMNECSEAICPLCSRFHAQERLHAHIKEEHPRVREATVRLIQAYHKGWAAENGACEPCWKSFRDAGRTLSVLKQARAQPMHGWI